MLYAGIDAGSRAVKIVLIDSEKDGKRKMFARLCADQKPGQEKYLRDLYESLLEREGVAHSSVGRIVGTGYGRKIIPWADSSVTEITCHARGVRHCCPEVRTIVEIGGQDSKVIHLEENGTVRDFAMNDRCAAGTGRFIEVLLERLGLAVEGLEGEIGKSKCPATISSTCVVFAESEIVALLAKGTPAADILTGVMAAVANRVGNMAGRIFHKPVVFTGGVARVPGMNNALSKAMHSDVISINDPQYTGALGAALLAEKQDRRKNSEKNI